MAALLFGNTHYKGYFLDTIFFKAFKSTTKFKKVKI